jgi:hemolysin III
MQPEQEQGAAGRIEAAAEPRRRGIFHLKEMTDAVLHGAPSGVRWNYDRAELVADGVVHAFGVFGGLVAAIILIVIASLYRPGAQVAAVVVYAGGLMAMLGISATYNLLPVSRVKWWLRRLDHSAIYLLIAATYTPFILQVEGSWFALALLVGNWTVALLGTVLKITLPGRFDRLSIVLYLAMGWSGVMLYDTLVATLSPLTLTLIAIGGSLYSLGVIFHVWERLRFQNAIWHSFVLLGASFHYGAVLDLVLP